MTHEGDPTLEEMEAEELPDLDTLRAELRRIQSDMQTRDIRQPPLAFVTFEHAVEKPK